jgi:hypothetical protein
MQGTPLGVGPCPGEACEACPLVGLALMRLRIRARVAFEPLEACEACPCEACEAYPCEACEACPLMS